MFTRSVTKKTIALALASSMLTAGLVPVSTAQAHDRHNPYAHNGNAQNWSKKAHRQFHRTYGRGVQGEQNYKRQIREQQLAQQRAQQARAEKKRRKKDRRDMIAAGIIGLAVGAIIAGSANNNSQSRTTYTYPEPQYPQREPLTYYEYEQDNAYQTSYRSYEPSYQSTNEPEIIRYEEAVSLEPWTEGWRNWCENNYRSFNARTGTFRGYDGLDHFCVPK